MQCSPIPVAVSSLGLTKCQMSVRSAHTHNSTAWDFKGTSYSSETRTSTEHRNVYIKSLTTSWKLFVIVTICINEQKQKNFIGLHLVSSKWRHCMVLVVAGLE